MKHTLPDLPYPKNALVPHISAETLEYHWGKHHKAYVDKLNALIGGTEFENMTLDDIIRKSSGPIFNNAAQHWNHSFYWRCLSSGATEPRDGLLDALNNSFGNVNDFYEKFAKAALDVFGSGWAWLVLEKNGRLVIQTTSNADNPLRTGQIALLTIDVWEHAYYIDYRNARAKYIEALKDVMNWDFAAKIFASKTPFRLDAEIAA